MSESELEITIQPDGTFLIPGDRPDQRELVFKIFKDIAKDSSQLHRLFEINDSEMIFGSNTLCG